MPATTTTAAHQPTKRHRLDRPVPASGTGGHDRGAGSSWQRCAPDPDAAPDGMTTLQTSIGGYRSTGLYLFRTDKAFPSWRGRRFEAGLRHHLRHHHRHHRKGLPRLCRHGFEWNLRRHGAEGTWHKSLKRRRADMLAAVRRWRVLLHTPVCYTARRKSSNFLVSMVHGATHLQQPKGPA